MTSHLHSHLALDLLASAHGLLSLSILLLLEKNYFHCITRKLFYSLKCVTMQLSPMHVALKTICPLLK